MSGQPNHTNRLIHSTSPYLLQHAHNPVDWYPWGEEALRRAREEDKPIFLSIGYAACHWCHVMERESFESEEIAEILNRDFVPIKVDREERPDLDEIYMMATQLMTQSGGWPMSVFLLPDLKPFYAGTYFPPEDRWGRPGFKTLLQEIARAWQQRRHALEEQASRVAQAVAETTSEVAGQGAVSVNLIRNALHEMARSFDAQHGGFGRAPKFPPSMRLELLLQRYPQERDENQLAMATVTLDRMARGGMYDQVGGGFHRYSVDERWLVPHFEKMLYDNALLARVYTLAYEQTANWYYRRVAREILDYVLREMTHPEGGFYSATDADSEGVEGKFFVWDPREVREVLGEEDGALVSRIYDITPEGNFEGHSIPNLLRRSLADWAQDLGTEPETLDARLAELRQKLYERREQRVHPLLDDKVLTAWNALMIRAFAEGYRVFQDERYRRAAERASNFVLTRLREDDRLLRSFREGQAQLNAYHEDYAYLTLALLDLHQVTQEERWREEGLRLLDQMDALFWDEQQGGYFFTSHDHEELITRTRSLMDGATPSSNSMAVLALVRAARLTGDERYRQRAEAILRLAAPNMAEIPAGFPNMLVAANDYLSTWPEGIRIPGGDAVQLDGFLSHSSVLPGGRFWLGVRMAVAEGFHVNSHVPEQAHLYPTRIAIEPPAGFTVIRESYPAPEEYQAPFQEEVLSVYSGEVVLGVELEVGAEANTGHFTIPVTLSVQPCDDQQCFPPMEARMRFGVDITHTPGQEQNQALVQRLQEQATG